MSRCAYHPCADRNDGWFLLAPGVGDTDLSIFYPVEPSDAVPLCQWHALLVGDQAVSPPLGAGR